MTDRTKPEELDDAALNAINGAGPAEDPGAGPFPVDASAAVVSGMRGATDGLSDLRGLFTRPTVEAGTPSAAFEMIEADECCPLARRPPPSES